MIVFFVKFCGGCVFYVFILSYVSVYCFRFIFKFVARVLIFTVSSFYFDLLKFVVVLLMLHY